MFYKLRILFTILSAICLAALLPIGTFWGLAGFIPTALLAAIFFVLMLLCKQEQEKREPKPEEDLTQEENSSNENELPKK
ncbi:MAG: hypothetical protein IJW96_04635 [Clostridia bacterium]|nr:hypothetical protein [Clostridia bacterium]